MPDHPSFGMHNSQFWNLSVTVINVIHFVMPREEKREKREGVREGCLLRNSVFYSPTWTDEMPAQMPARLTLGTSMKKRKIEREEKPV